MPLWVLNLHVQKVGKIVAKKDTKSSKSIKLMAAAVAALFSHLQGSSKAK